MSRRWLRRSLIALPIVALTLLVGACGSAMYTKVLWEKGLDECGRKLENYSGWGVTFDGKRDVFVCEVRNNNLQVVARRELPLSEVMGRSGDWPVFSELVAHELETVDEELGP